jgi:hypothetical protein
MNDIQVIAVEVDKNSYSSTANTVEAEVVSIGDIETETNNFMPIATAPPAEEVERLPRAVAIVRQVSRNLSGNNDNGWEGYLILCFLFLLGIGMILLIIFSGIALDQTSMQEQKDICHQSAVVRYVWSHITIIIFCIFLGIFRRSENSIAVAILVIDISFIAYGGWGIKEVFLTSCFDKLKDRYIYGVAISYLSLDFMVILFTLLALMTTQ